MNSTFRSPITIHRKITWLLLFSIFSLAVVSWLIFISKRNIEKTNSGIYHTYDVIRMIQQTLISGSGSETEFGRDLDSLQELTRDNQHQQKRIDLIRGYLQGKGSFGKNSYGAALPSSGHPEAMTGVDRAPGGDSTIRSLLYLMMREEEGLLALRKSLNKTANTETAYGLIIARFAGFLLVAIILIKLNKDIGRRKKLQENLIIAIREAQEAKRMEEQFLANMSHEIRTPMNGIKGMTDLLLGSSLSEGQHELALIIKRSVNNLLVIINDILDFSKIKAGKLNIQKIDFSLKDVLNGVVAIFEHRLKKKELPLRVDVDPDIPDQLTGDPQRLNQVLINLLGNAIKFTTEGHIDIQVALEQRSDERVLLSFSITDTGVGIPESSLPYIFDKFTQAGHDISTRYGGTGLGLTICKQLLHLQGGDITAKSNVGKGSVFSFYLPYGYNDRRPSQEALADRLHDYSNLLAGKRFLVAEDNEINQKLIDHVLQKAGGTVQLVNNGAEAIEYLQNGKNFDLIIMDLQMPKMDGYAATEYIRNDLRIQTPIIAMTATAMKGEHLQCLESGMNEYMTKPFEFADLYNRIESLLNSA